MLCHDSTCPYTSLTRLQATSKSPFRGTLRIWHIGHIHLKDITFLTSARAFSSMMWFYFLFAMAQFHIISCGHTRTNLVVRWCVHVGTEQNIKNNPSLGTHGAWLLTSYLYTGQVLFVYLPSFNRKKGVSLIAQLVKNPPTMQETLVRFLGREDLLENGEATHSSIFGLPLWLSW